MAGEHDDTPDETPLTEEGARALAQNIVDHALEGQQRDPQPLARWVLAKLAAAESRIDSASDQRTVNNTMRHKYRVLSDAEKLQMEHLKDAGNDFLRLLYAIGNGETQPATMDLPPEGTPQRSRELALAQTKIEEAVMWAVKHVTKSK